MGGERKRQSGEVQEDGGKSCPRVSMQNNREKIPAKLLKR